MLVVASLASGCGSGLPSGDGEQEWTRTLVACCPFSNVVLGPMKNLDCELNLRCKRKWCFDSKSKE